MKIYDSFLFFNELDILELRLNILDPYVDKFVILESNTTFSGLAKPFNFENNKQRFSKFLDKIIYIKHDKDFNDYQNLPLHANPINKEEEMVNIIHNNTNNATCIINWEKQWCREWIQREYMKLGHIDCDNNDIVMISDVDEIPNPKVLEKIPEFFQPEKIYRCLCNMYYYYFNVLKETNWRGTIISTAGFIKNKNLNDIKNLQDCMLIERGGWHFSFMGGVEMIKEKIKSYSHQEYNTPQVMQNIADNVENNTDVLLRGQHLQTVPIDSTYPEYLLQNIDKYKHLIK
jgi:beta-1,4-mannosyl-glycoprotein beta-1,4-N-acetylglucosaminyltransferase